MVDLNSDALIATLEADVSFTEFEAIRAEHFKAIADRCDFEGNVGGAQRARWQVLLFSLQVRNHGKRSTAESRFQPLYACYDGTVYPDESDFSGPALDFFRDELGTTTNPIHRVRYADYLWERNKNYTAALTAIRTYIDLVQLYTTNNWLQKSSDALDRACELAMRLRNQALIDEGKRVALCRAEELTNSNDASLVRW